MSCSGYRDRSANLSSSSAAKSTAHTARIPEAARQSPTTPCAVAPCTPLTTSWHRGSVTDRSGFLRAGRIRLCGRSARLQGMHRRPRRGPADRVVLAKPGRLSSELQRIVGSDLGATHRRGRGLRQVGSCARGRCRGIALALAAAINSRRTRAYRSTCPRGRGSGPRGDGCRADRGLSVVFCWYPTVRQSSVASAVRVDLAPVFGQLGLFANSARRAAHPLLRPELQSTPAALTVAGSRRCCWPRDLLLAWPFAGNRTGSRGGQSSPGQPSSLHDRHSWMAPDRSQALSVRAWSPRCCS
jgi:hypothetical protein